jgi:hypothetical protein
MTDRTLPAANGPNEDAGTSARRPETVVREYRSDRDYRRDARNRREQGWRVVSVLQRPAPPGRLRRVLPWGALLPPETEYLVTYHRPASPPERVRPLQWLFAAQLATNLAGHTRSARLWWALIGFLLLAFLVYGLWSFFADAVPL